MIRNTNVATLLKSHNMNQDATAVLAHLISPYNSVDSFQAARNYHKQKIDYKRIKKIVKKIPAYAKSISIFDDYLFIYHEESNNITILYGDERYDLDLSFLVSYNLLEAAPTSIDSVVILGNSSIISSTFNHYSLHSAGSMILYVNHGLYMLYYEKIICFDLKTLNYVQLLPHSQFMVTYGYRKRLHAPYNSLYYIKIFFNDLFLIKGRKYYSPRSGIEFDSDIDPWIFNNAIIYTYNNGKETKLFIRYKDNILYEEIIHDEILNIHFGPNYDYVYIQDKIYTFEHKIKCFAPKEAVIVVL